MDFLKGQVGLLGPGSGDSQESRNCTNKFCNLGGAPGEVVKGVICPRISGVTLGLAR